MHGKPRESDIEIILVDDGSPDHVSEMCDEWAKKDARMKVIHKKNADAVFFGINYDYTKPNASYKYCH